MNLVKERKLFFAWNMESEKKYLEEQSKKGLHLKQVKLGLYIFEEGSPRDYVYQFDFRPLGKKDEEDYLDLMQDWEMVQRFGSWYYFRKERDGKNDQIYSDYESVRKMHYRLLGLIALMGLPLYYQVLIFFPLMAESEISNFYKIFQPITIILMLLHFYVIIRLIIHLKKISNTLKE